MESKSNQLTETIINLVTLAIKANDVIIQGTYSGAISDEVQAVLNMCKEVHKEYVEEDNS